MKEIQIYGEGEKSLESSLDLNQLGLYSTAVLENEKSRISTLLKDNLSLSKPERRFLKRIGEQIEDILEQRPVGFSGINPGEETLDLIGNENISPPIENPEVVENGGDKRIDKSDDPIYQEFISSLNRGMPMAAIAILEKANKEHANTYNIGEDLQNNGYPFSKLLHASVNKGIGNIYFDSIRKIIQVFKDHISAELMKEIEKHIEEIEHLSGMNKEIKQSERHPKFFLDDVLFYTMQGSYDDDKEYITKEYTRHLGKIQATINKLILSGK